MPHEDERKDMLIEKAVVHDLTERARPEQQMQTLLEAMPDGVLVVNAEGNIVIANAQSETLFGYPREELLGQPLGMFFADRHSALPPLPPGVEALGGQRT